MDLPKWIATAPNTAQRASSAAMPARRFAGVHARLSQIRELRGGAVFFLSATLVNLGNYAFNLIFGRWLGPALFAEVNLLVSLVLFVSFVAATLSMVTAKFVATHQATQDTAQIESVRAWLNRVALALGLVMAAVFVLGAPLLAQFFQSTSGWPFVILGLGMPFYMLAGVERGSLQGTTRFGQLALSYQSEMWLRLALSALFLVGGLGINGIAAAMALALLGAWWVAKMAPRGPRATSRTASLLSRDAQRTIARFALAASGTLVGQILINNSDILIVKHFFAAEQAGQYGALALIGRIVFFATWSVVMTLFPVVAQKQARGEPHGHLLGIGLGLVAGVSTIIIGATLVIPDVIVKVLFGTAYMSIAPLLWMYAVSTAFYALANVIISYRLSANHTLGGLFVVVAGVAQVIGLWWFHDTLGQVVAIQVALMVGLFTTCLIWLVGSMWASRHARRRFEVGQ